MCGLYASIGLLPDKTRLDRIAHRGPDGEGWAVLETPAGTLTLGHRRLSIIDLDVRAAQPMKSADARYILIFNGEIYNYIELRAELVALGHEFQTQSDCEVLLTGLKHWDLDVLPKLRGMFAFILFDTQTKRLIAARDPFGIKPLYFCQTRDGLVFGSEPKQLYDLPGVSRKANRARLWDFVMSQSSEHTSETMFEAIMSVRPGHFLELDLSQPLASISVVPQRWFEPPKAGGIKLSLTDAAARFTNLFKRSVELHLRADVPVGSCLSGGLDSSSIVGIASQQRGPLDPISTFTAIFPGQAIDEAKYAKDVVAKNKADPTFIEISQQDLETCIDDVIWHQDEPFGSTSILAQWFVFQAIGKSGIKVVLDGQGADEQLGGYHGLFVFHHNSLLKQRRYVELMKGLLARKRDQDIPLLDAFDAVIRRIRAKLGLSEPQKPSQAPPVDIMAGGSLAQYAPKEGSTLNAILARDHLPALDTLGELCLAMTVSSNLPMLLRFEDRNSMAHSVEARVPFVEPDLIAFTLGLGQDHKLVGSDNKKVLRAAMSDVLPASVLDRRDKLGFSTPESEWIRGGLKSAIQRGVTLAKQRFPDLLDWNGVDQLFADALVEGANADPRLWRIANLGLWAERFDLC
jgi:asparagine synthase (glutamine-hydrolysing)